MIGENKSDEGVAADPLQRGDLFYMLPETNSALARIPQSLHAVVLRVAKKCYDSELESLLRMKRTDTVLNMSHTHSQRVLEHSAKLSVLSLVGHLSFHPWHLADKAKLSEIANDIDKTGAFDRARSILIGEGAFNLYVASSDSQDVDEYLKGVAKIVKSQQIYHLVLDEDLIDRRRYADLLDACSAIGWPPHFVGLATKGESQNHPAIQGASKAGVIAKKVWSNGRPFDESTLESKDFKNEASIPDGQSTVMNVCFSAEPPHCDAELSPGGLTKKIAEMRARQLKALRQR